MVLFRLVNQLSGSSCLLFDSLSVMSLHRFFVIISVCLQSRLLSALCVLDWCVCYFISLSVCCVFVYFLFIFCLSVILGLLCIRCIQHMQRLKWQVGDFLHRTFDSKQVQSLLKSEEPSQSDLTAAAASVGADNISTETERLPADEKVESGDLVSESVDGCEEGQPQQLGDHEASNESTHSGTAIESDIASVSQPDTQPVCITVCL